MNKKIIIFVFIFAFLFILVGCNQSYFVMFDGNGGTLVSGVQTQKASSNSEVVLPTYEREGYIFDNWYIDAELINPYDQEAILDDDLYLYAKWTINQYTITFNSNGGSSLTPIIQEYNTVVVEPTNPTKEGYTFNGWYSDSSLTKPYIFTTMPLKNIILYAKWAINKYTITFNSNGGSLLPQITQNYNTTITEPTSPTRDEGTFDGWYSDSSLTTAYTFTTMPAENITLYAKWIINTYNINYYIWEKGITQISLGGYHSSVLTLTGRIFTWGHNRHGQLGDGTIIDKKEPVEISSKFNLSSEETITQISLGSMYSSVLTSTGRVFTWGSNDDGQLGDGTTIDKWEPVEITSRFGLSAGETITQISLGYVHSSALTSTGRIFTWGSNDYGQLGDGTTIDKTEPVEITSMFNLNIGETITQVSHSSRHSSALTSTGRIFTWGYNWNSRLGDGTATDRHTPVEITSRFGLGSGETIIQISLSGHGHSSALTSTGRIFTWGLNYYGQLGDGTTTGKLEPIEITSRFGLSSEETITQISLGGEYSSVLTSTGRIFTWGQNVYGELGDGTTTNKSEPIEITSSFNLSSEETIIQISLGIWHSSALNSTGRIFTWGYNGEGQLGDGTTIDKTEPIEVSNNYFTFVKIDNCQFNEVINEYEPTKEGYTFSGWYQDLSMTTPYSFNKMPASDLTLYGKWTINQYTITFDSNGGSKVTAIMQDYNTMVTEPSNPTKVECTFVGWYSDSSLTIPYTFTTMPSKNITLYAKWTITLYTITFDSKGGSSVTPIVKYYNEIVIKPIDPTRDGCTFGGWYSDSSLTKPYTFTAMPDKNITLYAKWIAKEYMITFDSNGGSKVYEKMQDYNTAILEPDKPVKDGYTFDGWYSDSLLTMSFTFTTMPPRNITLYAKWIISEYTKGLVFTEITNQSYEVTGYNGTDKDVVIPSRYKNEYVVSIDKSTFSTNNFITSIHIPSSVTSIDSAAFKNTTSLATITFEEESQLTIIRKSLFEGATSLTSINIPSSVTSIGENVFTGAISLTSINVSKDNQYYSSIDGVLFNKDKTVLIKYPEGNTNSTYVVPSSVTSIDDYAFSNAIYLISIVIPTSVTSIGAYAFSGTTSLTSINIPASVTSIKYNTFENAVSLKSIQIPDSITSIGSSAFRGTVSLTSINIPASVVSIGGAAFYGATSLTSINIPSSVTSIGDYAFLGATSLKTVTFEEGSKLTSIGDGAFSRTTSLTSISIPSSVTSIGERVFIDATSLISINVSIDNQYYSSIDGVLFNKDKTVLLKYPAANTNSTYVIPSSVTSIDISAFSGATSLKTVTFEEVSQLTSIGDSAFRDATSLTSINIPTGVTSIGNSAFLGATSLKTVTFEEGSKLTSIGHSALFGATSYIWNQATATIINPTATPTSTSLEDLNSMSSNYYNFDTSLTGPYTLNLIIDMKITGLNSSYTTNIEDFEIGTIYVDSQNQVSSGNISVSSSRTIYQINNFNTTNIEEVRIIPINIDQSLMLKYQITYNL